MDLYYEIYPEKNVVVARHSGSFEIQEYMEHILCFMEDPDFQEGLYGVIDLTKMSINPVTAHIDTLIHFMGSHEKAPKGCWACITSNPTVTAMAMIYQRGALQHDSFGIFSTWEAAERFLGIRLPRPAFLQ